jgi:hypothetical protein
MVKSAVRDARNNTPLSLFQLNSMEGSTVKDARGGEGQTVLCTATSYTHLRRYFDALHGELSKGSRII